MAATVRSIENVVGLTEVPGDMSASKKTEVFEILYNQVRATGKPWTVTNEQVVIAIDERNRRNKSNPKRSLSRNNPANFLKDFIRKPTCNENWPMELKRQRITARQRYGEGLVFEFVPYAKGDTLPFPDRFEPTTDVRVHEVECLSISQAARELGRRDEAWLTQVIVNQRIAHIHFAVMSPTPIRDLTHLQMSVKTQPEIDAVFMATLDKGGSDVRALVICEAKQKGERLLENQIREQVQQAFHFTKPLRRTIAIDAVIPISFRVLTHTYKGKTVDGIYLVEFGMVDRAEFERSYSGDDLYGMPLNPQSDAFYVLEPSVAGISDSVKSIRGASRP